MRIAMFTDTFIPDTNGVAVSSYNLFKALNDRGHYCVVVTSNPFSKEVTFEDNVLRIPGIEMKQLYGYNFAAPNRKAQKILRKLKIDVVHVQSEAGMGIFGKSFARKQKIPYVYTYHTMYEDYTYYATKGRMETFAKTIIRRFSRWQAEIADEFISPSEKTKVSLREYGVQRYVNVIPTGVDFSKFKYNPADKDFLDNYKKEYGLDNTFNLVYVGRVAKEKSIDVVIRGYALYVKDNPEHNSRLIIVGGGPAIPELEELADQLHITSLVHFVGKVLPNDIGKYYHLGEVFVSASISETQGLTFMEAMAAERILLCRFDEGLVGVIKDGESGYFFRSEEDFGAMVNKIRSLSKKKIREILDTANVIVDYYSNERFVERCEHVYLRALRNSW
ncbi:MAG: Alpha-monoglucosyldiacylglycerol synthase [Tenericutes bacterium ADurb.Bin087]|jgi:1,2-diacylglycerol 3-alpha-glucosyltransferase|nr:MAG: Alpha-monoglucosyldiacylglycerol synthase [Tenericutes bacterium ADurb.Bin087]